MEIRHAIALDVKTSREGFFSAPAKLGRTGIQNYRAGELGLSGRPASEIVRVYRSPEEVFAQRALDSIKGKPITVEHPGGLGFVTSDDAARLVVGHLGDDVRRSADGIHIDGRVYITHAKGVQALRDGLAELSLGYSTELVDRPGVTRDGLEFDARQTAIEVNHVALVRSGRCGPSCRIQAADAACPGRCGPDAIPAAAARLLEAKDAEISALRQRIAERDARIANHLAALGARDSQIVNLRTETHHLIAARDSQIANLLAQLR